jgi:hypothetical protein
MTFGERGLAATGTEPIRDGLCGAIDLDRRAIGSCQLDYLLTELRRVRRPATRLLGLLLSKW